MILRKDLLRKTCLFVLLATIGFNFGYSKSKKQIITIQDVKLWRSHSVTLSDNGKWYTVLYSLVEKPKIEEETKSVKKKPVKKQKSIYCKNAKTDVLYIRQSESGKEFKMPNGSKPIFSPSCEWIAYEIKPLPKKGEEKKDKKKEKKIIELLNLKTGKIKRWESNASYKFTRSGGYFFTSDDTSLFLFNLKESKEHYIGNIGEYLFDKKSDFLIYTIDVKDKRGNGIYAYNLKSFATKSLTTGDFVYSKISWNKTRDAIAAFKFKKEKEIEDMEVVIISNIKSDDLKIEKYKSEDILNFPKEMKIVVNSDIKSNKIIWSNDNKRLFFSLEKKDNSETPEKDKDSKEKMIDKTSVNVWHWKDKKLLSQQMFESKNKKKYIKCIFKLDSKSIIQLTGIEIQKLLRRADTDRWAIGTDNRQYISDWDVPRMDLYRIDLISGEKELILKNYCGRIHISPKGESAVLWIKNHYWYYDFKNNSLKNISKNIPTSFLNKEYDYFGSSPSYGFVGWVKDGDSIIVNHKFDLWQLPIKGNSKWKNLTKSVRNGEPIRFRFDDTNFYYKKDMDKRYIDLSTPIFLSALNTKTKYSGYFHLSKDKITKLIYKPASFSRRSWGANIISSKFSDTIIFRMGDYTKYPESYLSNNTFLKYKKITTTNPQQSRYKWGYRILVNYKNDDGIPLQGVLSIPNDYKKGKRLPMIVRTYEKFSNNLYSYPGFRIAGWSTIEMMYVSSGYLFFQPDIHFNVGTPHSDMHECIDSAIRKVIELGYVDEKHIGYEGFSFGGHCGMYISTQKNKFAAIVAGAGVSNLIQGFNVDIVWDGSNEQDYYITQQGRLGTNPADNLEMFIRESAVFNVKNMDTPLLLYHGTADKVVNWEHSFGLYSILRFLKKPVVFLSYRGEGHGIRKKSNRLDLQKRLKEYFDHYLKGKKAPKWLSDGLPYKPKPKSDKKDKKGEEERKLPMWL